jgi:transposase
MHATIIGLDLAKNVFQLHAEDPHGTLLWKKRLRREALEGFLRKLPPALIGMEACGSAHHWGRVLSGLGHTVRLMHAKYVKAYVKRGKSDLRDAEAICEAVQRSNMRFVPIKSIEQQIDRATERARELLVKQRTQLMNATRALLAELGVIAAAGLRGFKTLADKIDAGDAAIPRALLIAVRPLLAQWHALEGSIEALEEQLVKRAKSDERMQRLMKIPGVGPLTAHALVSAIGDPKRFRSGRDCAAWAGLTPLTDSSAEKTRIGHISRQGDHSLRRLLVLGAANMARQANAKAKAQAKPRPAQDWLLGVMARRPVKVAMVAQAAKTARIAWALLRSGEDYRASAAA